MSERVQVTLRFRPLNEQESKSGGTRCVDLCCDASEVTHAGKRYTFDGVFDHVASQDDIFEAVGRPVVDNVLRGYNGTVLAYGQTGAGKTYTMTGPEGGRSAHLFPSSARHGERGLVCRVLSRLFGCLEELPAAEVSWEVSITVAELFKEALNDLAAPPAASVDGAPHSKKTGAAAAASGVCGEEDEGGGGSCAGLRIREDRQSGRGVYIEGMVETRVRTVDEALRVIGRAMERKHVSATGSNETSSRSHTIVTLAVRQTNHVQGDARTTGLLNLVDLAGSERVQKSGAAGDRLKEAQTINLSLSLLGNVINKLTDGRSVHIPYRDSKLTRLLQDSFGGNSKTTLLCNCSPSALHSAETLGTIRFATRAKQITNQPRVNKELQGADLRAAYACALDELVHLRARVATLEAAAGGGAPTPTLPVAAAVTGDAEAAATAGAGAASAEAAAAEEALASVLRELEETRCEREEALAEARRAQERAGFYEKRERAAEERGQEARTKADRERMAADSWMRKHGELVKENERARRAAAASSSSSTSSATPKKRTAAAARRRIPSSSFSTPVVLRRRSLPAAAGGAAAPSRVRPASTPASEEDAESSVSSSGTAAAAAAAGGPTPAPPAPHSSVAEQGGGGGGGAEGVDTAAALHELGALLSEARAGEASLAERERAAQARLADAERGAAAERERRWALQKQVAALEAAAAAAQARAESAEARHEHRVGRLDREVEELSRRLRDAQAQQQQQPVAAASGSGAAAVRPLRGREEASASAAAAADTSALSQLQRENQLLYEQNKENARRLIELTRRTDEAERRSRTLEDERKKLRHEVELSSISAELKTRILGERIRASKAAFQHRLLQCFERCDEAGE